MCRILAVMSANPCNLREELSFLDNNLCSQSYDHPDGWGIAHYVDANPQVVRSIRSAHSDALFETVAHMVHSQVWLAHLRRATHGVVSLENAHPFLLGNFAFAHNGHIRNLASLEPQLLDLLDPAIRLIERGQTDSELFFHILLSFLKRQGGLDDLSNSHHIVQALLSALVPITDIIGPLSQEYDRGNPTTQLTFVLSNPWQIFAYNGGKPIFYKYFSGPSSRWVVASEQVGCLDGWDMIPFGALLSITQSDLVLTKSA